MKVFLPLIALATIGATTRDEPVAPGVISPPDASRDAVQTPVVDPDADYACEDDPLVISGAEAEAQLFRDPARPDTLQPIRAVDYQVNGCGLLVLADGTLMRPPENDERQPVSLQPAQ